MNNDVLKQKIEFIKGVGPLKASLLNSEVGIFNLNDMLHYFPFRYEDRSNIKKLIDVKDDGLDGVFYVQVVNKKVVRKFKNRSLKAKVKDASGYGEMVWVKGIEWIEDKVVVGKKYLVFGKPKLYKNSVSFFHPEINEKSKTSLGIRPVYPTTEKLKRKYINTRFFNRIIDEVINKTTPCVNENLSEQIVQQNKLISRASALQNIHLPKNRRMIEEARKRLKFEELFFLQLQILQLKNKRLKAFPGYVFNKKQLLSDFYKKNLPFELTNAQKKVIKECYENMCSGKQMNRLVQGDVGSGKTIVAFLCMLFVVEDRSQVAFMAPTEVLADQHYKSIKNLASKLNLSVAVLTGSTKEKERKVILNQLIKGEINILIGTHALIEKRVEFMSFSIK